MRTLVACLACCMACSEPVSPEPLGDYTSWKRVDVTGQAPGHADTYRIIYINPIAADVTQDLRLGFQEGSVIVKEIYKNVDGAPGDLSYIAIMRRDRPIDRVLVDQGGWLFSRSDKPNGAEVHQDFCWNRCHVAAPYNGAWYDYRK